MWERLVEYFMLFLLICAISLIILREKVINLVNVIGK